MAIFYPPIDTDQVDIDESAGYHAERAVLEALEILDDKWRIFHGLEWRYIDDREGEKVGETDLVIFHPDLGILVVEVKGGPVKIENGEWVYESSFDRTTHKMKWSPLKQARINRFALLKRLQKTSLGNDIPNSTAVTHTAWFPDITWTGPVPDEVPHAGFILDSRHLENPERQLRAILREACPNAIKWSPFQINTFIHTLSPEVNLIPPLGSVLGTIREKLYRMTAGQIKTLGALRKQKRLLVEGCAGSGKTLLAVRLAHDHLLEGRKVLFTCFNKNLACYVATEFQDNPLIYVANFHELTRRLCEKYQVPYMVPEDEESRQRFFDIECAELLEKVAGYISPKYDTIIVDEALDFKDAWWIALESLGANDFSYYLFYDRCQNLYNDTVKWDPPFHADPYSLDQNVRNTKPIGDFAAKLGGVAVNIEYAVSHGPKPEIRKYGHAYDIAGILKGLVEDLIKKQKVVPDDIVVLSPYRYDHPRLAVKKLFEDNTDLFSTDMSQKVQGKVRISTIQAFKGLEADVVILCGIDGHQPACKPANLYVGVTRARSMLYVIQKEKMES